MEVRQALKRRGILAAAGAVVAGIVAKQAAQPVRATFTDTNFVATGGSGTAFSNGTGAGYAFGGSFNGTNGGVSANSVGGDGVFGASNAGPGFSAGVFGQGSHNFGVIGDAGAGPFSGGFSTLGVGVQGQNAAVGVVGMVNNASNSIAVYGNNTGTGANAIGVYGASSYGTGVYGITGASNQYGVLGTTSTTNSTAVAGIANQTGCSAFSGGTTNPAAYAGVFQGNVVIQGQLVVSDPSYKSGALQHPDGSHRLVYCVESPESWIEDVGTGTLTNGKATVTFDKDFAAVTHTDNYHVFLTEYGGNNALYVDKRSAIGFEVHTDKAGANSTFSWKVMVKAKSSVKNERLGKFTMPNIPLPDVSKFKAPETPIVPKKP